MKVHVPQTRDEKLAGGVHYQRIFRQTNASGLSECNDSITNDDHRGIGVKRTFYCVDYSNVSESERVIRWLCLRAWQPAQENCKEQCEFFFP